MKIIKIAVLLAVLSIVSIFIGGTILKSNTQTYDINEEKTLGIEGITRLQIESVNAEATAMVATHSSDSTAQATILSSDSNEMRAVLHGTVNSHSRSNFVKLLANKTGQTIKIETKQPLRIFSFGEREKLYLDIHIPKNYEHELVLNEVSADAKIKDLKLKSFNFTTVSGNLSGDNISAEIKLDSVSGNLNLGKSKGNVIAKTVSGKIDIEYVSFENLVTAETFSGNITLRLPKESCFDLNFKTVSGELNTDFSLEVNGLIKNPKELFSGSYCNEVNTTHAGKINVETVSGNLHLFKQT